MSPVKGYFEYFCNALINMMVIIYMVHEAMLFRSRKEEKNV